MTPFSAGCSSDWWKYRHAQLPACRAMQLYRISHMHKQAEMLMMGVSC